MKSPYFNAFSENFYHKDNIISVLNTILVHSTIIGSLFIKVPQIIKIFVSKTACGISFVTIYLDIFIASSEIVISIRDNLDLKLYLDAVLIHAQNLLIVYFMWKYSNQYSKSIKFLKIFLYIFYILFLIYGLPNAMLPLIGIISIPISSFSKFPQIRLNNKNKHTGSLSPITYSLLFLRNMSRIFVVFYNINNIIYMIRCVVPAVLNFIILFQIFYYWKNTNKVLAKTKIE
ncbi:PQ-loop repeat-containing protein [Plasmodium vinckei brucechwatti]|uniref:PQ-loop repeat-containing protein n=1 Tax=Plasmodium vinckei brucechwatti TaxID=119398 RepID=A0A6V7S4R3_PLAVN|nr:PQ-loop repeat-containing protein [Plasmodium vinckei brucechwatti]